MKITGFWKAVKLQLLHIHAVTHLSRDPLKQLIARIERGLVFFGALLHQPYFHSLCEPTVLN